MTTKEIMDYIHKQVLAAEDEYLMDPNARASCAWGALEDLENKLINIIKVRSEKNV